MRSMCVGSASILIYLGRMNAVYEWGATVKTNLRRRARPRILQNRPRTGKCEDARTNEEIAAEGCAVDLPLSQHPGSAAGFSLVGQCRAVKHVSACTGRTLANTTHRIRWQRSCRREMPAEKAFSVTRSHHGGETDFDQLRSKSQTRRYSSL